MASSDFSSTYMLGVRRPSIWPSIGTENPIPEEMDHREIAVRVPVMNEVQFLFPSEPCNLSHASEPGKPHSRARLRDLDLAWLRADQHWLAAEREILTASTTTLPVASENLIQLTRGQRRI